MHTAITDLDVRRRVERLLGHAVVAATPARWGFAAATATMTLDTGDCVVVQRRTAAPGVDHPARVREAISVMGRGGLPVPTLLAVDSTDGSTGSDPFDLLVFRHRDGTPGPELLEDPRRGPILAGSMGRLQRRIAATPPGGMRGDPAWQRPRALEAAFAGWVSRLEPGRVPDGAADACAAVVAAGWSPCLVHADFVPANVLVAGDAVVLLLDLGEAGPGHPLLDLAWWSLVVRHHHPEVASRLHAALLRGAGVTLTVGGWLLPAVALLRALERADGASVATSEHALRLVTSAAAWWAAAPGT